METERYIESFKISSPGGGVSVSELEAEMVEGKLGLPPETSDFLSKISVKECVLWLPKGVAPTGDRTLLECTAEYSLKKPTNYNIPVIESPQQEYAVSIQKLTKFAKSQQANEVPYILLETEKTAPTIELGPITLEMDLLAVTAEDGSAIDMTAKEVQVLEYLANNRGVVCSREDIYEEIWGDTLSQGNRNVDVIIRRIRKKIEDAGIASDIVETRYSAGYYISDDKAPVKDQ